MSELTREKIEAWRNLGAAYVEHMPDGEAMFEALCDMALESITLKLDAVTAELADLKQRILPQFAGRAERAEKEKRMAEHERDTLIKELIDLRSRKNETVA